MATAIQQAQSRLGVRPSGSWDGTTSAALLPYQARASGQYPMLPHGHPDAATLANLGYFVPAESFPRKWAEYVAGGDKPGSFSRDVQTALDQVPRWAWGTLAGVFGVIGYLTYRGDKKRSAR